MKDNFHQDFTANTHTGTSSKDGHIEAYFIGLIITDKLAC
jgi:hypothetical protein